MADGHKPLKTLNLYVNINFDALKLGEICKTTSAEVSLGWEYDVYFHQHGRSFSRNFSFARDIRFAREFHAVCLWAYILRVPTLKYHARPD